MIEKLVTNSRANEIKTVSLLIIRDFKTTSLKSDTHLNMVFIALETATEQLSLAMQNWKAESELEVKEELRNDKVQAMHYMLLGFIHHPDPTISRAAQKLEKVFDNNGFEILDDNFEIESSMITLLLSDMAKKKLQPYIEVLTGYNELISTLQAAHSDYEDARVDFETKKVKGSKLEDAISLKKTIVTIINDLLVVYLRAMQQVNETIYGDFAGNVAQILADNNELVKKRRKKSIQLPLLV